MLGWAPEDTECWSGHLRIQSQSAGLGDRGYRVLVWAPKDTESEWWSWCLGIQSAGLHTRGYVNVLPLMVILALSLTVEDINHMEA